MSVCKACLCDDVPEPVGLGLVLRAESEVVRCFDFTGAMEAAERAQAGRIARAARRRAGRANPKPRRRRHNAPARPAERGDDGASDAGAGDCIDDRGSAEEPCPDAQPGSAAEHAGSPCSHPAEGGSGISGVSGLEHGLGSRDAAGSGGAVSPVAAAAGPLGTPAALAQAAAQQGAFRADCAQGTHRPPHSMGDPDRDASGGDGAAAGGAAGPGACPTGRQDEDIAPWGSYAGGTGAGGARRGGEPCDALPCDARGQQGARQRRREAARLGPGGRGAQDGAQQLAQPPPPDGRACRAGGQSGMQAWAIVRPRQVPVGGASGRGTRDRE